MKISKIVLWMMILLISLFYQPVAASGKVLVKDLVVAKQQMLQLSNGKSHYISLNKSLPQLSSTEQKELLFTIIWIKKGLKSNSKAKNTIAILNYVELKLFLMLQRKNIDVSQTKKTQIHTSNVEKITNDKLSFEIKNNAPVCNLKIIRVDLYQNVAQKANLITSVSDYNKDFDLRYDLDGARLWKGKYAIVVYCGYLDNTTKQGGYIYSQGYSITSQGNIDNVTNGGYVRIPDTKKLIHK